MIPSASTSSETGDQVTWLSAGSSEAAWSLISQAGASGLAVDSRIFSQAAAGGGGGSSRQPWESCWESAMLQLATQPQYSHHDNSHHASNVSYGNDDEDAYSKPSHGSSGLVDQLVMQAEPLLPGHHHHHHHHHHHELVAGLRSNALMTADDLLGGAAASSSTTTAHSNYNSSQQLGSMNGWGLPNMGGGSGRSSMGGAGLGHEAAAAVSSSSCFQASAVAAMQHGYGSSYGGLAGGYGGTLGGPPGYQLQADQRPTSSSGLLQLGQLANALDQRRLQEILKSTRMDQLGGHCSTRLGLNLGLGGRTYFAADDYAFGRLLGKRQLGRPDSPLQQAPSCQAEGCKADLGMAKHYHRRHKVCEYHSKASTVIVGGQTQRFCQQCSRFHVLGEFDDGKRSCRKRLADHNRRRRKPQPTPVAPATAASNGTSSSSEAVHATVAKEQDSTHVDDEAAAGKHHEEGEEAHNDPSSRNGHTSQLINKDSAPGTPPVEHHEQKKQKIKDHTAIAEASPTTASTNSESEDLKVKAEAVSQIHHNVAIINSQGNWGNGGLGDIAEGGGSRSYSAERPVSVSSSMAWLKPAGAGNPDVRTKSHTTSDSNNIDGPNPLLQATSNSMHIKYNQYHHHHYHHHHQLYLSNHDVASTHNKDDHGSTINEVGSDSSRIKTVQDGGTLMQRALFMHDSDGTNDDDNGDDDDDDDDDGDEASHHLTMTSGHTHHIHHPLYNNTNTDDTASRCTLSSGMQRGSGQDLSRRQAMMINGLDSSPAGQHADVDGHNNIKLFSAGAAGDHHLQDFKSFTVNHRSIFGSGNLM